MKNYLILLIAISFLISCNSKDNSVRELEKSSMPVVNSAEFIKFKDSIYQKGYEDGQLSYSADERSYNFAPINSMRINLFHKLNEIDSIKVKYDWCNYYSKDGVISFNNYLQSWQIDTTSNPILQKNNYKNISQEIPNSFKLGPYYQVEDRIKKFDHEIVLMGLASEGCYSWCAIFDTLNNKVYNGIEEPYNSLDYDNTTIYLGQKYGFSKIDRKENYKIDYLLLPTYDTNSNIKIIGNNIFLATNKLGIQKIDVTSDSVTFWSYKELMSHFPRIKQQMIYDGFPLFTNFCQLDSLLFLGCRVVQDYWMGYTRNEGSLLFIYSLKESKWNAIYIDKLESIGVIFYNKNKLWFGGHQIESQEGDDPTIHGGVGYYDLVTENINYIISIPKNELILGFKVINNKTIVESCKEGKINSYKIESDNIAHKIDSTVYSDYREYNNIIASKLFELAKKDSVIHSERLKKLLVTPRIIVKDSSQIELVELYNPKL